MSLFCCPLRLSQFLGTACSPALNGSGCRSVPTLTHFHRTVRVFLNHVLQQRWMGRAAKGHNHLPWPPRSPDITPCDFFLWGFVKDSVYIPPLPMSLKELRDRITHALQTITADMLHRVWDEFDYRVDVCRVTQGAHIEGS